MSVIVERAHERVSCHPSEALATVNIEDDEKLPDRLTIEARVGRLIRERENMGPVNLRADIETAELDERISTML